MPLQSVVRWLLPREDHFFDYIEKLGQVCAEAAHVLYSFRDEWSTAEDTRQKVQNVEHAGDRLVHEMEDALARTFVTPIDREDLQRLATDLDTIVDLINGAARACAWFGVDRPKEPMVKLMQQLVGATELLRDELPALRRHEYPRLIETGRKMRAIEKEADVVYREAVSALFKSEPDARVILREKQVFDCLENAVDQCEKIGHLLVNLAVKHG
jgi:predicted phosphate transport protein (TIGR00153 family)